MVNEKKTENIVREHFRNDVCIKEDQQSDNPQIVKLLLNASKKGSGRGKPEFIYSEIPNANNLIIIIECKADTLKHESVNHDKYAEYAVDGVLLYSSYLSKEFDVLAIAVSGQTKEELKVSHYLQLKGSKDKKEVFGDKLLSIENYVNTYNSNPEIKKQDYEEFNKFKKNLNEELHSYDIPENRRALLISAILIALNRTKEFKKTYQVYTEPKQLIEQLLTSVKNGLNKTIKDEEKLKTLTTEFAFIETNLTLNSKKDILMNLITKIDKQINNNANKKFEGRDILGELYIEFLKYGNSDAGMGIVLTPYHITQLFCDLAQINKDSVLLDNCTGTSGFLIAGMERMISDAKNDAQKILDIKQKQLIGIEYTPHMFTIAASNMILHGDGHTKLIHGNCFDDKNKKTVKEYKPNIGFLNPPYASKKNGFKEMDFILNNLEMLEKNGICIGIIPMSCVLATSGKEKELKEKLLKEHTLEAVLSMPNELFINSDVGTVTCIIVVKAHNPHPINKETFFGYYKEDGFYKNKTHGRQDYDNKWESIQKNWVNCYINNKEILGLSIKKYVTAEDEWCAEAYMETDYSKITKEDFIKSVKDFIIFQEMNLK